MKTIGTLLVLISLMGCSRHTELRLSDYQSISRFEAVFSEATPKDFAKEIMDALEKYPRKSTYHYVREDEAGTWEYGVLVVSETNEILFQKRIGSET